MQVAAAGEEGIEKGKEGGEDMTQQDIDYASRVFIERVPNILREHAKKIIMYGSCARGDYNNDSDVDIAILTDINRIDVKAYDDDLMDVVTDIAMESNVIVEYICLPIDEYNEKKSWYRYFKNIENDGKVLYG